MPAPWRGEESGEVGGRLRFRVGELARESELVDVGTGIEAGERGKQCGVGEQRVRQEVGGGLPGGRLPVVPQACGQRVREPGVDVGLDVAAGAAGQQAPD